MSYVVMARKWRPAVFEDVIAQNHVTVTLQNAVRTGRIAHAYLFAGPRGSGKTTTARILAKALNCDKGPTPTPCNTCRACESITRGTSPDVLEIDAASNRGIEEIRSLREKVIIGVSKQSGHKVYIIDEVHMLTPEAFNALLKTLEEPPSHVIFILATTEHHRVPSTILSRCQRFNFRRIPSEEIVRQLIRIAEEERITISEEALFLIARRADGALRDAQGLLDQVVTFNGTSVTQEAVREALGILDRNLFFRTTETILKGDQAAALGLIDDMLSEGGDAVEFVGGLLEHLRNLLLCKVQGAAGSLDLSEADRLHYQASAEPFAEPDLLRMIQIVSDLDRVIGSLGQPRFHLELAILKLVTLERTVLLEDLLDRLGRFEERTRGEGLPSSTVPIPKVQEKAGTRESPGRAGRPDAVRKSPPEPLSSGTTDAGGGVSGRLEVAPLDQSFPPPEHPTPVSEPLVRHADPGSSGHPPSPPALASWGRVVDKWPTIVTRVKEESVSLAAHLEAGTPLSLDGQALLIGFPSRAAFSASHIRRKKRVLEEIIASVIGSRLQVDSRVEETVVDGPDSREAGGEAAEKGTEEVSPSVQTVLRIFDGEIIRR